MFGKVIKYLALGGLAAIIPGVVANFLPGMSNLVLGFGLMIAAGFAVGFKIPFLAPALGIAGGAMVAGPFIGGLVGNITGGSTAAAASVVIG